MSASVSTELLVYVANTPSVATDTCRFAQLLNTSNLNFDLELHTDALELQLQLSAYPLTVIAHLAIIAHFILFLYAFQ